MILLKKFIAFLLLILVVGCESDSVVLKPTTLSNEYPGDISNVDKVELVDGSSGERKIINDKIVVQEWLNQIKDIELTPHENQEEKTGYLFRMALYEGEQKNFEFLSFLLNDVYYETNHEFVEPIRTFFEEQFGREF